MSLEITERLHLDRQVTLARVVFAALALVALLDSPAAPVRRAAQIFLCSYLILAAGMAIAGRIWRESPVRIPLAVDVVALILFLFLTPSVSPFWSLLLFVVFALAADGHTSLMLGLVVAGTGAIIFRSILRESAAAAGFMHWFVIGLGIFISGLGIGYLGAREREHLERQRFLERIMGVLKFERGLAESIRQLLGELTLEFECEQACLAIRDEELERLFVWRVKAGEREAGSPESLPLSRSDTFLSDSFEISMCWEFRNGTGAGFGWDRRTGAQFRPLPPPPGSTSAEFGAKSFMAVAIDAGGRPAGRVILVNPRGKFFKRDLRWLEQIVRQISSPLENVFLLLQYAVMQVARYAAALGFDGPGP